MFHHTYSYYHSLSSQQQNLSALEQGLSLPRPIIPSWPQLNKFDLRKQMNSRIRDDALWCTREKFDSGCAEASLTTLAFLRSCDIRVSKPFCNSTNVQRLISPKLFVAIIFLNQNACARIDRAFCDCVEKNQGEISVNPLF